MSFLNLLIWIIFQQDMNMLMYSSNRTIIPDSSAILYIVNFIPFTNKRCFVGRAKRSGHSRNTPAASYLFFLPFFVGQAPIELGDAYFEQCHFGVLDGVACQVWLGRRLTMDCKWLGFGKITQHLPKVAGSLQKNRWTPLVARNVETHCGV